MSKTLIFDNGAHEIKAGYSSDPFHRSLLNCITKAKNERKRVYISDQLKECKDLSSLFLMLPFQKGYLVNLETEHQILNYVFGKDCFNVDFEETSIIFTEPHFNFKSIQETINEILFEEYQFESVLRLNPSTLSAYNYLIEKPQEQCQLVVDVGYSFTHVVPYCRGRKIADATFRNSVGGKALTNYLKETISYRQMHVMEETYVINQCKEDVCFVSTNFEADMATAKKSDTFVQDYVLPDFTSTYRGYVKKSSKTKIHNDGNSNDEQIIRLNHERFALPEILFRPSDVGLNEMGLSELVVHSINQCSEVLRPHLAKNIVLTGGCCLFSGFSDRIKNDVRAALPDDYDVEIYSPIDPVSYAWQGGKQLSSVKSNFDLFVTRREYNEKGHEACYAKFTI